MAEWPFIKYVFCIRKKPESTSASKPLVNFAAATQHNQTVIWKRKAQKDVAVIIFSTVQVIPENSEWKKKKKKSPCSLHLIYPIYKLHPACPFRLSKNTLQIKTADVYQIESVSPVPTAPQSLSSLRRYKVVLN